MSLRIRPIYWANGIRKRRWQAAFTFAEVLAALVFMAIVIPVAMEGVQLANRAGVMALRKGIAMQLANAQMQEFFVNNNWQNSGQNGSFAGAAWRDYHWRLLSQPWIVEPQMRLITLEVYYLVQNKEYQVNLSTLVQLPTQQ